MLNLGRSNELRLAKNGFFSPTKGSMTLGKIMNEITDFVKNDPEGVYRVVIGSDSQVKHNNGIKECDFVTAIVIHRRGCGGRYFWKKEKVMKIPVLRERIYIEASRSLTTALELAPFLKECMMEKKWDCEIHIDVGPNGKTKEMVNEVVGMVSGSGFTAKTKPDSWGASSVADKHT